MSTDQASFDASKIEQTKQQIRVLVHEIAQLSKSDLAPEQYYTEFLQRVVASLAAVGGAVWRPGEGGHLNLAYQIKLSETLLDKESPDSQRHLRLLQHVMQTGEGKLVPPESGGTDVNQAANPTRYLLVLAPLRGGDDIEGVVEVFQRPEGQPAAQRGYLQFLMQMCELAGEWVKTHKLKNYSDRQSLWGEADQFARLVHESLDQKLTSYTICNEGRRIIGCDRVSVAIRKGKKCVIEAISGQDTLEQRSNIVAALTRLATRVVASEEPLWYSGSTEDLPPQIEEAVEAYVEESYAKTVAVLPLRRPATDRRRAESQDAGAEDRDEHRGEVIGALIVEQIETELPRGTITPRINAVYEHSARALTNSHDHSTLFLMPVWRTLGKAAWVIKARTLPKTVAIAIAVLVAIVLAIVVPYDLNLHAKGELKPATQQDVFADLDGVVKEVYVKHGQDVVGPEFDDKGRIIKNGTPLVRMENTDLEIQRQNIRGERDATNEQIKAVEFALVETGKITLEERTRMSGQLLQLRQRLRSQDRQLTLIEEKRQRLVVYSPKTGQIVTWNVEERLMHRPVKAGELLVSVFDPKGNFDVILNMSEQEMGHLHRAEARLDKKKGEKLAVSYILATDPETRHTGVVEDVHRAAEVIPELGNVVKLRVDTQGDKLLDPRPGATVMADVRCGRTSIGYAFLRGGYEKCQLFFFWYF